MSDDNKDNDKVELKKFDQHKKLLELKNVFDEHHWALRAFGALLESADLSRYFSDEADGPEYRWGLNQILELYIKHQESRLDQIWIEALNDPATFIDRAESTYEMVKRGAYISHEVSLQQVRRAINKLDRVISKFSGEYPKAEDVREKLIGLRGSIIDKMIKDGFHLMMEGVKRKKQNKGESDV